MAAAIDLMRKCEMCNFTHLKRVQLCVKPAAFLVMSVFEGKLQKNNVPLNVGITGMQMTSWD